MMRWLSGSRFKSPSSDPPQVTNDPLAAIADLANIDSEKHIYAVSRVNPLYKDEGNLPPEEVETTGGKNSPRKSVSSGYESRSDSGSCTESDTKPKRGKRQKHDGKKRGKSNHLIDNVLAANYSSIKRRPKKYINGSPTGTSNLSPIPEGRIDLSIPAPIWPRCKGCQQPLTHVPVHNGTTDPLNFMYKYNEQFPGSSSFRIHFLNEIRDNNQRHEYQHNWEECFKIQFENNRKGSGDSGRGSTPASTLGKRNGRTQVTQSVLQDLVNFISQVMTHKNNLSADEVLHTVSESIQKSINLLANPPTVKGEFILYSPHREDVYSTSSSSGFKEIYAASSSSSSLDSVTERLKIFHQHRDDDSYRTDEEKKSDEEHEKEGTSSINVSSTFIHHQRDLSSSSLDSSTSFSPASSSSSAKALSPVFMHEDIYSVPNSVCNIITYTTADAAKNSHNVDCGSSAFDKLISAKRKISDDTATLKEPSIDPGPVILTSKQNRDLSHMKKVEHPYYIAMGRPDFTLDLPQAERMMRKIATAKRQRCWCRLTTSFLGLVFFLLSVVIVSLVITRGRKMFGAI